ncbi:DNA polymerase III subunit alpha (plasmid) [Halobacillus litoralis]|uniref:DNA polymerase III subunit alpha n=1 Tax=Halobacillus litoralis TaxID=45668 RepID=UPI001CFE7A63|nr:DNA polymerase III subunit alpha [Halobacillus litoralis]WLR49555.1 DNA polymerase III subunit alpha [Halobacillus litoralis]
MPKVELHQHGQKSSLDGIATVQEIVARAKDLGQPAVALTDHGHMQDFYDFYQECKKEGIKPIIGNEAYFTEDRFVKEKGTKHYHLVLLAKNTTGLRNLFKITSKSHLEGFYGKPRVDWDLLDEYGEGIIVLSGCLAGYPQQMIAEGNYLKAKKVIKKFKKMFGEDFYLEIQPNEHGLQKDVNKCFTEWNEGMGIDLVATTDAHYMESGEGRLTHMVYTQIADFNGEEIYKHNYNMGANETYHNLINLTGISKEKAYEAVDNTEKVADKVEEYEIDDSLKLPHFPLPDEYKAMENGADEYLKQLCRDGWKYRGINALSDEQQQIYKDRIMEEFEVIMGKGFSEYFLIVQDFIWWSRNNNIIVGYGRGSAGGSLVAYLMGIVELDPIEYDLLFERFLNPDRNELPDIDVDFADREAVVNYVKDTYGHDKVCSVITFGTFGAKGVVRDVAKALHGKKQGHMMGDKLSGLIPETPSITLKDAMQEVPELEELLDSDHKYQQVKKYALEFEGRVRQTSTHACAIIISDRDLTDVIPLQRDSEDEPMAMVDMDTCEALGLVKFDFLGLKTLSVINNTSDLINESEAS